MNPEEYAGLTLVLDDYFLLSLFWFITPVQTHTILWIHFHINSEHRSEQCLMFG